jgi:radical SAM superfamily enzyme YgiQ (UPF0313 family)
MRVLLVQAYLGRKDNRPIFPLGLCYIGTALSPRHTVKIYDPNVGDDPYGGLEEALRGFAPDVVGLSFRNIDNQQRRRPFYYFKTVKPTAEAIKRSRPDCPLIIGGAGFSIYPEKIMGRIPQIDYGVYLEGEQTMVELLDNLDRPEKVKGVYYRKDGSVRFSGRRPLPDFAALPAPRRDFLDIGGYTRFATIGVQTKRGCPFSCTYCSYKGLNGAVVRKREPREIVDEIEGLVKTYGIKSFMFADSIFNAPLSHATEICNEIIARGLKVSWNMWCSINFINEEFLLLARKAGCVSVSYSPDALSDEALSSLKKGLKEQDVRRAYGLAKKIKGIQVNFGFFVNPPGETLTGLLKTLFFVLRANIGLARNRGGAGFGWIRIEPHTEVHKLALKKGIIDEDTELLPEDEGGLGRLFYTQPGLEWIDGLVISLLNVFEPVFKLVGLRQGARVN